MQQRLVAGGVRGARGPRPSSVSAESGGGSTRSQLDGGAPGWRSGSPQRRRLGSSDFEECPSTAARPRTLQRANSGVIARQSPRAQEFSIHEHGSGPRASTRANANPHEHRTGPRASTRANANPHEHRTGPRMLILTHQARNRLPSSILPSNPLASFALVMPLSAQSRPRLVVQALALPLAALALVPLFKPLPCTWPLSRPRPVLQALALHLAALALVPSFKPLPCPWPLSRPRPPLPPLYRSGETCARRSARRGACWGSPPETAASA